MGNKETIQTHTFPSTPFLLVEENEENGTKYYIVESWKESNIKVLEDCHFMQNIEFTGHTASEEEIEKFMSEEEE